VTDSATVLQIREALALVEADIDAIADALGSLARRYRDTPMAGRSNLQQAETSGTPAALSLPEGRRPLRRRHSNPSVTRTITARSAPRFISPRLRCCRRRRSCPSRLRFAGSSTRIVQRPPFSPRDVRHSSRALRPSPDLRSLLILTIAAPRPRRWVQD
jgi:hypothetical protein